jgi:5'-3' exonuclease
MDLMTFTVGQSVSWIRSGRVIETKIRRLETITRADGQPLDCATLELNRFVPCSELFRPGSEPSIQTPVRTTEPRPAARKPEPKAEPARSRPAATAKVGTPPATEPTSRGSQIEPVDVLAFDFMNLLVRAFHAGKPTENHAVRSMFQTVASAVRQLRPSRIVFALDGGHVHRSKLLPSYKAHRPEHAPELKAQIELAQLAIQYAGMPAVRVLTWEADDVLASIVDRFPCVVICSSDKDLLSLHGRCRIFHPWSGGGFVDPETKLGIPAGQVTDYLALCGDTSDGIPGVKGIGEKTAAKLLNDHDSLEGILTAAMLGQIPGKIGQTIKEQRSQALLCQEVVQLRSSLPLPEIEPWTPPPAFQQKLQSIGLGSVAGILDGLRSQFGVQRSIEAASMAAADNSHESHESHGIDGSHGKNEKHPPQRSERPNQSAATEQAELFGRDEFSSDQPVVDPLTDRPELQPVQPSREHRPEFREPVEPVAPAETGGGHSAAAGSADDWLRKQYESGQRCRDRGTENPWKRETLEFVAWDQGFRGVPFSPEDQEVMASSDGGLFS